MVQAPRLEGSEVTELVEAAEQAPELFVFAGVICTALGSLIGAWWTARAKNRDTTATAGNQLIDQLQEELTRHRKSQDERMTRAERRQDEMEAHSRVLVDHNNRYRDLLHKHRAHIYDQKPPPPPEWPEDLPR